MKILATTSAAFLALALPLLGQGIGIPGGQGASAQNPYGRASERAPRNTPDGGEFYRQNPELIKRYGLSAAPGSYAAPTQPQQTEPTFSIEFLGGPPEVLVEVIKNTVKDDAPNIIISPEMEDVELPPFKLQNVTFNDLFQALNNLAGPHQKGQWQLSGSNQPIWVLNPAEVPKTIDPLTGMLVPASQVTSMDGYAPPAPAFNRSCQIFPVAQYLDVYKVEDITTAIQTAWNMLGDDAGAQMKLHKDTDLLIAVGTPEQLSVINQILSSLDAGLRAKGKYSNTETFDQGGMPANTTKPKPAEKKPADPEKPKQLF